MFNLTHLWQRKKGKKKNMQLYYYFFCYGKKLKGKIVQFLLKLS